MGEEGAGWQQARNAAAQSCVSGIVLDASGLIALERNNRQVSLLLDAALDDGDPIIVPASALAQVIRNPARQVRIWRMIQHEGTEVASLTRSDAQAIGLLLARTGTSDVVDAHVVICAQKSDLTVITSDPLDLTRLDPELQLIAV